MQQKGAYQGINIYGNNANVQHSSPYAQINNAGANELINQLAAIIQTVKEDKNLNEAQKKPPWLRLKKPRWKYEARAGPPAIQ